MNILRGTLQLFWALLLLLCLAGLCTAQGQKKTSYALFLDNSGSMRSQFDQVLSIGKAAMRQIRPGGPVAIFNFTTQGRLQEARAVVTRRREPTQDQDRLEQTIDGLYVIGGQTTLLDAILAMNEAFDLTADDASERVIILVTDGEDRKSQIGQATLIEKLKLSKTKVFAVGMVRALSSRSKSENLLKNLTKGTGGRVVFANSAQDDPKRLISDLGVNAP